MSPPILNQVVSLPTDHSSEAEGSSSFLIIDKALAQDKENVGHSREVSDQSASLGQVNVYGTYEMKG